MLKRFIIILECSRIFALPMTIMSWLIIFTFSMMLAGNVMYGVMALFAVCLVHLATNVLDDYFDYKSLIKQVNFNRKDYLKNSQKTKCRYFVSGVLKPNELLYLAIFYLFIAGLFGIFFYLNCGKEILYFTLFGGLIAVLYSFFSKLRLSEVAVGLTYGPALFGGIYCVMMKTFSWDSILLSIPSMFMTIVLLYNHTVMDYHFDVNEGHKTLANSFSSQKEALVVLKLLLFLAYTTPIILCIFDILDWQVFLVCLTIPLAKDLLKSMEEFSLDKESIPEHKWYHFPMENMMGAPSFMTRIYQSRNLMVYYSVLYSISIVLALR